MALHLHIYMGVSIGCWKTVYMKWCPSTRLVVPSQNREREDHSLIHLGVHWWVVLPNWAGGNIEGNLRAPPAATLEVPQTLATTIGWAQSNCRDDDRDNCVSEPEDCRRSTFQELLQGQLANQSQTT